MSSDPGRAAALIDLAADYIEQGWCQSDFAIDESGKRTAPAGSKAVAWCIGGALTRAHKELGETFATNLYGAAINDLTLFLIKRDKIPMTLVTYNDMPGRTQEDVLTLLRDYGRKTR